MRIAILTEYFPRTEKFDIRGGAEASAFKEARELAKKHEVTVLTTREPRSPEEYSIENLKIIGCGPPRTYIQKGSILKRLIFMRNAYKKGERINADIVIGYNFITHTIAWKIGKKLSIPSIARYHDVWIGEWIKNIGLSGILGEILERYNLSRDFDKIIAVTDYTKKKLEKHFPAERIEVVPNIVDPKVPEHEEYPQTTISCVARLVEYKRVQDLIKAARILIEEFPDIKCKIIGTGPLEGHLKRLTKDLKLEEHVEFCGFVEKHEDVLKVIASSHVFCLPSIVEGFGVVVVEAMRCSTPFVATEIPPLLEASGGKGGLFFKPGDWRDLAKKIKKILKDEKLYKKLQKEGLEESKRYSSKNILDRLERILESIPQG